MEIISPDVLMSETEEFIKEKFSTLRNFHLDETVKKKLKKIMKKYSDETHKNLFESLLKPSAEVSLEAIGNFFFDNKVELRNVVNSLFKEIFHGAVVHIDGFEFDVVGSSKYLSIYFMCYFSMCNLFFF